MGYQDEILEIRQQRAQRDQAEALGLIQERYASATQERDLAAAQGDAEGFENWDRECEQLESEYSEIAPPPPPQEPQLSKATLDYLKGREAFNKRHGAAAMQAYKAGHQLAVKAGLKPDTPDYFKFVDDALEMYGKSYNGTRFDPSEKSLHANEVCKMLGLTADQYNTQWRKMHAEGRDSNSQQRQMWGKKVG